MVIYTSASVNSNILKLRIYYPVKSLHGEENFFELDHSRTISTEYTIDISELFMEDTYIKLDTYDNFINNLDEKKIKIYFVTLNF